MSSRKNAIFAFQADPLSTVNPETDTTWLLINEAYRQGYKIFFYSPQNLYFHNEAVCADGFFLEIESYKELKFKEITESGFDLIDAKAIFIRQNPPINMEYLSTTYLLDKIKDKVLIINNPTEIRNCPEKLFVTQFKELLPPTFIGQSITSKTYEFIEQNPEFVIKPIYGFGGLDVQKFSNLSKKDISLAITPYLKTYGSYILQGYLPQVTEGDKRIILLNGEILGAIKRVPKQGSFLTNLAAGGSSREVILNENDRKICEILKPELKKRGLILAGIDVLDGFLIEINITSPTGLVAINKIYGRTTEREVINYVASLIGS